MGISKAARLAADTPVDKLAFQWQAKSECTRDHPT
jgi:hypothetical protein